MEELLGENSQMIQTLIPFNNTGGAQANYFNQQQLQKLQVWRQTR